jgi:hypothetical protein
MKQRGIFEKVPGSGVSGVRYVDTQGRYRREKGGTKSAAIMLYRKRKTEALQGRQVAREAPARRQADLEAILREVSRGCPYSFCREATHD